MKMNEEIYPDHCSITKLGVSINEQEKPAPLPAKRTVRRRRVTIPDEELYRTAKMHFNIEL